MRSRRSDEVEEVNKRWRDRNECCVWKTRRDGTAAQNQEIHVDEETLNRIGGKIMIDFVSKINSFDFNLRAAS